MRTSPDWSEQCVTISFEIKHDSLKVPNKGGAGNGGSAPNLPNTHRFAERLSRARDGAWSAYEPFLKVKNPISIQRTWFPKKYPPIK